MGAAREMDQSDFDLERFIDMFDEALTSRDERVVNALRSLMMMVILTKPEARNPMGDRNAGPLRRLYDDMGHINRRLHHVEETLRDMQQTNYANQQKYTWKDTWKDQEQDFKRLMQDEYHRTFNKVSPTRIPK